MSLSAYCYLNYGLWTRSLIRIMPIFL